MVANTHSRAPERATPGTRRRPGRYAHDFLKEAFPGNTRKQPSIWTGTVCVVVTGGSGNRPWRTPLTSMAPRAPSRENFQAIPEYAPRMFTGDFQTHSFGETRAWN
jgi:hypothetical protein